ncbi:ATP-binding protein [Niallia sp. Krafla_26]|uniref:ATP-binding protein n=1 Tax=Niallia sp. Krafla_26 TaxID=3064703 RepID=UPI003D1671B0
MEIYELPLHKEVVNVKYYIEEMLEKMKFDLIRNETNLELIEVEQTNNHLIVKVKDDGQGIDEENISNIFNPFFRGEKSRTKKQSSGSGLGLSIMNYIMKTHQGSIHVESQKGEGSLFTLTLPFN